MDRIAVHGLLNRGIHRNMLAIIKMGLRNPDEWFNCGVNTAHNLKDVRVVNLCAYTSRSLATNPLRLSAAYGNVGNSVGDYVPMGMIPILRLHRVVDPESKSSVVHYALHPVLEESEVVELVCELLKGIEHACSGRGWTLGDKLSA